MKILISLVILAGAIAAIYFMPSSVEESVSVQTESVEVGPASLRQHELEQPQHAGESSSLDKPPLTDTERQQKIVMAQVELQTLMKSFDENLKRPQKRTEIKVQIDQLLEEYNALILPVAVQSVQEAEEG